MPMKKQARSSRDRRAEAVAESDALVRAVAAANRGDLGEAERIAREIPPKDPHYPDALGLLCAVLLRQKRPHEAVAVLEEAAANAADPLLETHLALLLREIGRPADAQKMLYRAVERQPACPHAFIALGDLLRSQRRYAEAKAVLERGRQAAPHVRELSLLIGGVYLDIADPANAKVNFARALTIAPGDPDALQGLGIALQYEGEFARAAERFECVLTRNPGHHRARMNLGHCLLELGKIDQGIACLRAVVQAAPHVYGSVLKMLITAGRGRFWLRRSTAAEILGFNQKLGPDTRTSPPGVQATGNFENKQTARRPIHS
jgi:tetratricopeptide (TPR) repeat protein